jgi:hypothetical protein
MSLRFSVICAAAAALLLTGCVDRTTADAKLARGCEAGVAAMLPQDVKIGKVMGTEFTDSVEGRGFRHVKLRAIETDGWAETEKDYVCIFEESFGFMNMHHTAAIYQLRVSEDQIYGKSGREIMGDAQDFIRLTDAIREAMYQ